MTSENLTRRTFLSGAAAVATAASARGAAVPVVPAGAKRGPLGKIIDRLPPGRYDTHMHVYKSGIGEPRPEEFRDEMLAQGLVGGCLFSASPNIPPFATQPIIPDPEKAMDNCIAWCSASPTLYPFYWIDPGAPNALELVDLAVEKGFYGFKVIRSSGMPCDEKTMPVYAKIAEKGKPLLFHTGILFDGLASSPYFHPANFEQLLEIPTLRFALAHVSWPWHDECIAVYGKFFFTNILQRKGKTPTMFIDTTVGSPDHYRRTVLSALYSVYNVTDRVMFGTDNFVAHYRAGASRQMALDDRILTELGKDGKVLDSYYRTALEKFLFGTHGAVK